MPEFDDTLWIAGWIAGGVVVLLVAVLALVLIGLASAIRAKVFGILGSLERARDATAPLWGLQDANALLTETLERARARREAPG